jgi:hypothetical protein
MERMSSASLYSSINTVLEAFQRARDRLGRSDMIVRDGLGRSNFVIRERLN